MKAFKSFNDRGSYAACQRCVMRLLEESPLPWTREMLRDWYGQTKVWTNQLLHNLLVGGRVWRCSKDSYTSISRYSPQVQVVTDAMLKRYGFNL